MDIDDVGKAADGQHIDGDMSTHVDTLIHFLLGIGPSCQAYQEQQVKCKLPSCCHRAGRIGPQDRRLPPSSIGLHLGVSSLWTIATDEARATPQRYCCHDAGDSCERRLSNTSLALPSTLNAGSWGAG